MKRGTTNGMQRRVAYVPGANPRRHKQSEPVVTVKGPEPKARDSWWATEDAQKSRYAFECLMPADWGYYKNVPLASLTLAQQTEDRQRREGKHWTPPSDKARGMAAM